MRLALPSNREAVVLGGVLVDEDFVSAELVLDPVPGLVPRLVVMGVAAVSVLSGLLDAV